MATIPAGGHVVRRTGGRIARSVRAGSFPVRSLAGSAGSAAALAYFVGLALLVFLPVLERGFVLQLDMVFAPGANYLQFGLSEKGPLYYGRLPLLLALDAVTLVVPDWVVQKSLLLAIVAGSGYAAYVAARTRTRTAAGALFAGTLYSINPFVYVRLLAGHWWFLLGYAVLPLAVVGVADLLSGRGGARRAAAWTTLAVAFDPHVAVLAAVAYASLGLTTLVGSDRPFEVIARATRFVALTAALSAYWLLPALVALRRGTSKVGAMNALDLVAFGTSGTLAGNVPLSVAAMYGFWRGGYRLPLEVVPLPVYVSGFGLLLFLAATGLYHRRDRSMDRGLAIAGLVGFVLALGVSVAATAPIFRFLYETVPAIRAMRDAQKFVALLALAYALLGAHGVDHYADRVVWPSLTTPAVAWSRARPTRRPDADALARIAIAVFVVLAAVALPLAYAWPMLGGATGQLSTTEYPDGWAEANEHLVDDPGRYRVLFLPWHQYLTFPWSDGRIANPADLYFDRPVIRSRDIDLAGIDSQAPSPAHERIRAILEDPEAVEPIGGAVAPLGVKYVLVAKAADYRRYDYLREQPDLVAVVENEDLVLYENRAFASAPPPGRWPRAGDAVPWRALLAGTAIAAVAALVAFAGPALPRRAIPPVESMR